MKSSNVLNSASYSQILSKQFTLLGMLCFIFFLSFTACETGGSDNFIPDTDRFSQMAENFVQNASLPITVESFSTEKEVLDPFAAARIIVEESVFISIDTITGLPQFNKVKDGNTISSAQKDAIAQELVDNNFVERGDYLIRATWKKPDGSSFFTLGTMNSAGKPKFEPILYYNGIYSESAPNPMQRGWDWGEFVQEVHNGFGFQVVEVLFKVHIATDPANCMIVDPGPHVEITKTSAGIGWGVATTKGEIYWCNPKPDCECRHGSTQPAEECIKFVVVSYVTSGFSDVKVTAGANAQVGGVGLEAKIEFNASDFGAEIYRETIRNLCASGSTP